MRRVAAWVKSWFAAAKVDRRLSGQQAHLDDLAASASESSRRLERRASELESAIALVRTEIEDARRVQRRYEFALEEVREQNNVLELTIQTLTASHTRLIERYDAETAVSVRARVAATARE